jgi:dCTP diphosphatase
MNSLCLAHSGIRHWPKMNDNQSTVADLRSLLARFVSDRDWDQFHSPKNLSMSLAIEVAELMEHFQWITVEASREIVHDPAHRENIADELADCLSYILAIANTANIDLAAALAAKMKKNELKYPADASRGHYRRPDLEA